MIEKKRRHHHVWQHYLQAWTEGQYLDRLFLPTGTVCRMGTKNVAVRRDFYRLRELTPLHIEFVEEWIRRSAPSDETLRWNLGVFTALFELRKSFERSGRFDDNAKNIFDIAINNLEEDLHSAMESAAIPMLKSLKGRDRSVVDDEEQYTMLTWFLGLQLTRTTKFSSVFEAFPGTDLAPVAGVMRHIMALNVSRFLYVSRKQSRIALLRAENCPGLVTTDFPVVNIQSLMYDQVPDKLVLYYPVSPTRAIRIDVGHPEPGVVCEDLLLDDVLKYNGFMGAQADEQIFAVDEKELFRLQQVLGCPQ